MAGRERAEITYNKGISLLKRGCVEDAVACFEQALQQDPSFTKALQQRSFVLCLMGEPAQALADCNRAIAIDAQDPWSFLHRAMVNSKLQNFQSSVEDCSQALSLDPALLVAYTERGSAYCELRRFHEAISDFSTAIELNPYDPVNYVCRAVAFDEIGKYNETIKDFTRAIDLNPTDPIGYFSRALAHHKVDDFESALRDYDKVLALDSNFLDARQNRKIAEDQLRMRRRGNTRAVAAVANGNMPMIEPERKRARVYDIFTKTEIDPC